MCSKLHSYFFKTLASIGLNSEAPEYSMGVSILSVNYWIGVLVQITSLKKKTAACFVQVRTHNSLLLVPTHEVLPCGLPESWNFGHGQHALRTLATRSFYSNIWSKTYHPD